MLVIWFRLCFRFHFLFLFFIALHCFFTFGLLCLFLTACYFRRFFLCCFSRWITYFFSSWLIRALWRSCNCKRLNILCKQAKTEETKEKDRVDRQGSDDLYTHHSIATAKIHKRDFLMLNAEPESNSTSTNLFL